MAQRLTLNANQYDYENCDACKTAVAQTKTAVAAYYTPEMWSMAVDPSICNTLTDATLKEYCLMGVKLFQHLQKGSSETEICQDVFDLCKTNYVAIGGGVAGVGVIGGGGYLAYTKFVVKGAEAAATAAV